MKRVYIVAAKRSAIGKFLGGLSSLSAAEIGAEVISDVVSTSGIDVKEIDEVIGGAVLSAGQGQGPMRQAAIKAGIPAETPAYGINMICGSGMKSVMTAYSSIRAGLSDVVVAGGMESMSGASFIAPSSIRSGVKMGGFEIKDQMICDGLTDAFNNYHMGITAENIAEKYSITREAQDAFAINSQLRAIDAVDSGKFKAEITPIEVKGRKESVIFEVDEYPNRTTSLEKLSTLRPAFKRDGTVTAGNASGVNDGAAFLLLASESRVQELGLTPLAEIIAVGQGGVDPSIMGMGPVPAIASALHRADMKLEDMELLELNEAFAAQSLGVIEELCQEHSVSREWIESRTNICGGAIALGHPIGASGARILVTLTHQLRATGKEYGLASLCIGGGMGTAVIIKALQ